MVASSLEMWPGSWGYIAPTLVLALIATVAVALRFWSRRVSDVPFHHDDWLALGTLLIHHGLVVALFVAFFRDGLGFDLADIEKEHHYAVVDVQKLIFIGTILYGGALTGIRLSVIIFYFCTFTAASVRRGGTVLAVACIVWFAAHEALTLATCRPIQFNWDNTGPDARNHCITQPHGYIVLGAAHVLINIATVLLPVYEVMKLHLSKQKKLGVIGVFSIGGIWFAVSLAQLVAISLYLIKRNQPGSGKLLALLAATTGFEIYIAIIGACAPTLYPVYQRLGLFSTSSSSASSSDIPHHHRSSYTHTYTTRRQSKRLSHNRTSFIKGGKNGKSGTNASVLCSRNRKSQDEEERPFNRLDDTQTLVPAKVRGDFWTDISARPASKEVPPGEIRVQRDVSTYSKD